ncbi:MAG: DASS family sodium-coupled anion symporter [Gemmatimonadaceae bacterium]|nr:DASS family sodium-coupled anion symporter [Gemmatimonadaceae bacterium]
MTAHPPDHQRPAASGGALPPRPAAFRWPEERQLPAEPPPPPPSRSWEEIGQRAILVIGIAVSLWIYLAPLPAGLTPQGKTGCAIFLLCTTLWVTNAVPFGVTGLLSIALLAITGAMKTSEAFAAFGNSAVFFLIGVFIIGGAMVDSGLSKRSALLFLRYFERSPYAFATGMMLAAAFGTMWMPNQATSAMLFPIAVEVAQALRLRPLHSNYAKTLFLSLGWGAMVGSNASFLGSTRAALALGMLRESYGRTISFGEWVAAAIPMIVLGVAVVPFILRWTFPREEVSFTSARVMLEAQVRQLGPMQARQWKVATIATLTIAAWILVGDRFDLAVIALLGAAALFATRAIEWEEAERRIYWNIVLMYGGAIALGAVIDRTGAARWIVERMVGDQSFPPLLAVGAVLVGSLILSEFMSNAAAVAVMLPLAFSLGKTLGASPVALTLATSIGAGLDFALPFSSAPNTIVFASGYLRMMDVVKAGAIMTVASIAIVLLVAWLWWPILGLV